MRISLSRRTKGFATDEAAQELAEVRSAQSEGIGAMTKVVPPQTVSLIDRFYPSAKTTPSMAVFSGDSAVLGAIINLVDDLPIELLTITGDDYCRTANDSKIAR
jgi:hypothetical protein